VSSVQHFSLDALGRDVQSLAEIDAFTWPLLEGYMKTREAQILTDQEQLRRALSAALESQSQELLVKNHAINTSINGIMLADLDGRVSWVNASFLSLWGYASPAEAAGTRFEDFWAEEAARRVLDLVRSAGGWHGELTGRRRDGSSFSVELSVSLTRNEEGKAIGIMASFADVTERKRLQAQVLQVQKMDALGQLAGGITHDFNNLLTAISGYLQLLLISVPRDTQMYQDLMQIRAAVERGAGLTRQLRLFTRQATGKRQIVSLNDVARETWGIFKRTFPPDIAVELLLSPSLWPIEADPNQMSQVLVNLCVNARDAMMDQAGQDAVGTLTLETANIELSESMASRYMNALPGRYVSLRVSDTGIGMPPELLERVFIPFVTTKSARSGTGLGLAVVYGIVANHRGFIDVASAVGRGSTFTIYLPRAERQNERPVEEAVSSSMERGHGSILAVDDDQQVLEVMARALTACGYVVVPAHDGRDAVERFADGSGIDLVILDMMMPGMSGRECLARLREIAPGVRVLVTTGYTSNGSARDMLGEGALDIVEKPIDLKVLAEKVKSALGQTGTAAC
jgi:PAS domain S-box-containing protein